jgi:hypothetical protein
VRLVQGVRGGRSLRRGHYAATSMPWIQRGPMSMPCVASQRARRRWRCCRFSWRHLSRERT